MRAFVIDGPMSGGVRDVPEPTVGSTEVVIDVETVGLCGTDVELFAGTMPYFREGFTRYPLRPGHEWAGTVRFVGSGVDSFKPGDCVTGDTFLGCGECQHCVMGRAHLCDGRQELGVRGDRPGALAERVAIPATALHKLPPGMSGAAGAFVEPASCALRAVKAAGVGPGIEVAVWGTGTLGLLAAQFARESGGSVCVVGTVDGELALARRLGFDHVVSSDELDARLFDSVIEATGATAVPSMALRHTAPGGRFALLGVAPDAALLDARPIVLNDITVVGVLGGSECIDEAIGWLADGRVSITPLIAATVGLDEVATVLRRGCRTAGQFAPKIQVEPSRSESRAASSCGGAASAAG